MQTEPHITFHQIPVSPTLAADVRREIEELERVHDRITACRVVIEAPHRHHQQGRCFDVRVELHVPGTEIVARHSSDGEVEPEDAQLAVRDAFRAARRQLEDYLHRRRADLKSNHR